MNHIGIELSKEQRKEIRRVGRARQKAKTTERKAADRSGTQLHVDGFAAEYALATLLGVAPNKQVSPRGTKGVSLRARGASFNTKWVSKSWYDLRYWPNQVPHVEFMVLCDQSLPTIRLVGWVSRSQFMDRYYDKELPGMGHRWLVDREDLNPMLSLFDALGTLVPAPIAKAARQKKIEKKNKEKNPEPKPLPGLGEETHGDPA